MNCHDTSELLDALIDGDIESPARKNLQHHLNTCIVCNQELIEHQEYRRQMRQFAVPEPESSHYALLLREARVEGEQQLQGEIARRHRFQGFAAATVLACGILMVLNFGQSGLLEKIRSEQFAQHNELVSDEITVLINVPADMPGTSLALEFPAELTLQGFDNAQQLAWQVDLKKGANAVTLPVFASAAYAQGQTLLVSAHIEYNNKSKYFQLPVELFSPHNARDEAMPLHRDRTTFTI
ncbi:MAG: anti-sigma factor [Pseudomonadales bacterium]